MAASGGRANPDNKGEDWRSRFATNGLRRLRKSRENSELTPAVVLVLGQEVRVPRLVRRHGSAPNAAAPKRFCDLKKVSPHPPMAGAPPSGHSHRGQISLALALLRSVTCSSGKVPRASGGFRGERTGQTTSTSEIITKGLKADQSHLSARVP
jgi:hypothetical protein